MKDKKKEEILKQSSILSSKISETLDKDMEHISSIRYYKDFFFSGANIEENDVYIVEIKSKNPNSRADKKEKANENTVATEDVQIDDNTELELITYEIYDKNQNLIATVDSEGNVSFSDEYMDKLEKLPPEYYSMLDLSSTKFSLQEMSENDIELSEKDIEKYEEKSKKINFDKEEKERIKQEGNYKKTIEKAHGQLEIREYYQTERIGFLTKKKEWKGLKSIE